MGIFVSEQQLADEAERARRMPTFEPAFLNLHCNMRVDAEPKAINPAERAACADAVDLDQLSGPHCSAGLDLQSGRDLASMVVLFPVNAGAGVPFYWCAKAGSKTKE